MSLLESDAVKPNGYWAACRYYYGYLRLVTPGFRVRLTRAYPRDILERCAKRLLVVCPQSCVCPALCNVPGRIQHTNMYVPIAYNRAGQKYREYTLSIYCLIDDVNNAADATKPTTGEEKRDAKASKYFCAVVFANSLMTLNETQQLGLTGMTKDELYRERNAYIVHLEQLLNGPIPGTSPSPSSTSLSGQCRLVYWRDGQDQHLQMPEQDKMISLHQLLLKTVKEELQMPVHQDDEAIFDNDDGIDIPGTNPCSLYEYCYPMTKEPRGICLIINVISYSTQSFRVRCGAEEDEERFKELFSFFKFDIRLLRDPTIDQLNETVNSIVKADHSDYDAFVCCIMSHGTLGRFYLPNGTPVKICDIANRFNPEECPSLDGKPKMFFVQSYQNLGSRDESEPSAISAMPTTETQPLAPSLLVPMWPDFLMSYSTLPGRVSFRHQRCGTVYVRALVDKLKLGRDLVTSLKLVAAKVEQIFKEEVKGTRPENEPLQLPICVPYGIHKQIYLHGTPRVD